MRQQLWCASVELGVGKARGITVTCVIAREIGAPPGTKPVEWRLLTNRGAHAGRRNRTHGAYLLTNTKQPQRKPTLNEVLRLVARLGGFIGRKSDGEPGVKTIWLGLQDVRISAATPAALRDQ